ncbi:hypothetical protein B0O44_104543 [Pedobacter nutrimenti]|uniref:Uncharacterized protein n=1 Tax=Pedobacter nutrimenti TaxID=1241337 RepID=A0A318UD65_9SPHI|nr:hypothetical protein B0O44_104543 [Pedobacter nutrimenti]
MDLFPVAQPFVYFYKKNLTCSKELSFTHQISWPTTFNGIKSKIS